MAKAKVHPPWRSGFCGIDCPPESHDRCHGAVTHSDGQTSDCICDHHQETPVPDALHPFQRPGEPDPTSRNGTENEAPDLHQTVEDWTHVIATPRPWVDGTGEPGELEVMVRCFAMAAGDLLRSDDGPADYDETALLALLGILRASINRAQILDALLVAHLHEHHPWGRRTVEGIGEVRTYRRPKNTKWDDYGTAYAVVDWHLEQRQGELPDDLHEVVRWLLDAGAIDYYRTTALAAMGIDVDEYRHQEKGTRAVDVPVPD